MFTKATNSLGINIKLYYITSALGGLLFTVPIWVAFHQRYLNYSQMALIAAVAYAVTLLLELPTGALADLLGRKKTIIIGQLFTGIFRIYLGFAVAPWMFYVGWIGEAVGVALISGADTALLYDSLKELGTEKKFPKTIARSSLIRRVLLVMAVFSGGYFYKVFVGLPFILRGCAYMLMALVSLYLVEPNIDTDIFTLKNYIKQTKDGIKQLLKTSYLKSLTLYYAVVVGIIWVCQDYFVNTFAKDSGYTELEQSWAFAGLYLLSTIITLILTKNENKLPSKRSIFIFMSILLVFSLIPGYFASKFLVFFLILGVNTASALKGAMLDNFVNEEFDSKYRATSMSTLNLLVSGVYIVILVSSGPFQDLYSNRAVWSALGILSLIIVVPITASLLNKATLGK